MNIFYKAVCYILSAYLSLMNRSGGLFPPGSGDGFRVCPVLPFISVY